MKVPRSLQVFGPALALVALGACRGEPEPDLAQLTGFPSGEVLLETAHSGPAVVAGAGGPTRFAALLLEEFDVVHARGALEFVDGFYRAPANDGYEAVLARIESDLRQAGYGSQAGFEVAVIETPLEASSWELGGERSQAPAWTPLSASLRLRGGDGSERELLAFTGPGDAARTMLPTHAPSADVAGPVVFELDTLVPGMILLTRAAPSRSVIQRAAQLGAAAIVSSYLESYNVDPTGRGRERDAIQFRSVDHGTPLPVAMISPALHEAIETACAADPAAQLALRAQVRLDARPLRTIAAVVRGLDRPQEAFVVASHVQEPGANDNATGVVGLLESARSLAALIGSGRMPRPSRSLVFLWGDEFRQTNAFLESTDMTVLGGLSSDMTGASREQTGAICLLERMPDPAALTALPPDEHTPWGMAEVDPESLAPNGLAVIARCALANVGALEAGWKTGEHPYEGGSDHDIFIARGLPTALFWHFTDFTYHTSLDRLEMVDVDEIRRTAAAILSTALCVADPQPADLDRYLRTLNRELNLRVQAAEDAGDPELAARWRDWCAGARHWLRAECLRIPPSEQALQDNR
jgi:aminopeptidase YwaD